MVQRSGALTSSVLLELQAKAASEDVPRLGAQKAYLSSTEVNDAVNVLVQGYLNRQLAARDVVPLATAFSVEPTGSWTRARARIIDGDTTGQLAALIRSMGVGDAADVVSQLTSQLPRISASVGRARDAAALAPSLRPLLLKGFHRAEKGRVVLGAPQLEAMVEAVVHAADIEAAVAYLSRLIDQEKNVVAEGRVAGAPAAAEELELEAPVEKVPVPVQKNANVAGETAATFAPVLLAALEAQCPNLSRVIGASRSKAAHTAQLLKLQLKGAKAALTEATGNAATWPGLRGTHFVDGVEVPLTPLAATLCPLTSDADVQTEQDKIVEQRRRGLSIAWGVVAGYPRTLPRAFYALSTLMALGSATPTASSHRELAKELLALQCGDKTVPLLAVANAVEAPVEALLRLRECLFPSMAKDPSLALLRAAITGDACTPLGLNPSWADRDIAAVALTQTTGLRSAPAFLGFVRGHAPSWGFRSKFTEMLVSAPTADGGVSKGMQAALRGANCEKRTFVKFIAVLDRAMANCEKGTFVKFIAVLDRATATDFARGNAEAAQAIHTTGMAVLLLAGDFAGARSRAATFYERDGHPVQDAAVRGGMFFGELVAVMVTRLVVEQDTVRDTADVLRLLAAACRSFPALVDGAGGARLTSNKTVAEVMDVVAAAAGVGSDLLIVMAADMDKAPSAPRQAKQMAERRARLGDSATIGSLCGNVLRLVSGAVGGDAQEGLPIIEKITQEFAAAATAPPSETPAHVLAIVEAVLPLFGPEKAKTCAGPLKAAHDFVNTVAPALYSKRDATGAQVLVKATQALVEGSASPGVLSAREHRKLSAIAGLTSGDLRVLPEILQIAGITIAPDHLEHLSHTFRALTTMTDVVSRNADATPNANDILEIVTSQVFHELDTDRSGEITFQKFQLALVRLHLDISDAEAAVWFSELDVAGRGVLTRDDFLQTVKAIRHRFLSEIVERLGLSRELIYIWLAWLAIFLGLVLGFVVLGAYGFSDGAIFTSVITGMMPALAGVVALMQDTSQLQRTLSIADDFLDEFFQGLSDKHRGG